MGRRLLIRIRDALQSNGISMDDLRKFMRERGIDYPLRLVDAFAAPEDIYLIAGFIGVPASYLFEVTNHNDHFARAVFVENWPALKPELGISEDVAWKKVVEGSAFRGEKSSSTIRRDVLLILEGLKPPKSTDSGCQYPNCMCSLRCVVTGRMLEPGDWP